MDQLKTQLAVLKQHSFWIMCGGILVVCLVSWYLSTRSIDALRVKQLNDIKAVFTALDGIRTSNPNHANEQTELGMDALIGAFGREVEKSWLKQYERQSSILVWPASFDTEFIQRVDKLRPIEKVPPPPTPITDDLPEADRLMYRNYIDLELPTLAKTIGTEWVAINEGAATDSYGGGLGAGGYGPGASGPGGRGLPGAGGGVPGGGGVPRTGAAVGESSYSPGGLTGEQFLEDDKSIVLWAPDNQQQILQTHFGFVFSERTPSTLEVLYAQEDMWVLQNLMEIIKAANGNAAARHEAAIKQIDFVRIGRSAMGMAGVVSSASAMSGAYGESGMDMPGGGMGGRMSRSAMMSGMGAPGAMPGEGAGVPTPGAAVGSPDSAAGMQVGEAMGGMTVSTDPAAMRYVDGQYQPLDPAKLRGALTSKSKEDALLAVAKRMPVRMRFRVDQRKMNKVLAECGNSKLPVEVRQVRINRAADSGGMGGYGGFESMGGEYGGGGVGRAMPGMPGGMRGSEVAGPTGEYGGRGMAMPGGFGAGSVMPGAALPGGAGAGGAARAVGGENFTATIDPHLIEVELYGIVYIYNPVNRDQLGLAPATTAAAPPATPPTTPASSPPPATGAAPAGGPAAILPGAGGN